MSSEDPKRKTEVAPENVTKAPGEVAQKKTSEELNEDQLSNVSGGRRADVYRP